MLILRLAIVLSVLRFTDSDYPFGIFKLFLLYDKNLRKSINDNSLKHVIEYVLVKFCQL